MTITAQDIRDTFSEFSGASDVLIDRWIAQAERRINTTQWSEKADDATLWLTAHLLKIESQLRGGGTATAGPITTKKVGDLSVSYSVPAGKLSETFLASTAYGQQFLELRKELFTTRVLNGTVSSDCCT